MTVPTYDPKQAYDCGVFVENAYQMFMASPRSLTPPVSPAIFPATHELVLYLTAVDRIADDTEHKFFGFVAQSHQEPSDYVVAIRGTDALIEWLIDAEFRPTRFTRVPQAGDVEDGFYSIYQTMTGTFPDGQQIDVRDFVREKVGNGNLTVTGHSLGGALAIMLALDVAVNNPVSILTVYTLAAPRVGGEQFKDCFNQRVSRSYRVFNEPDVVPRLPPLYQQVDAGQEIDSKAFSNVKHSLACYHELVTYLYTLNQQSAFPLTSCASRQPGSTMSSDAAAVQDLP
jgi:triacylglycerol lipase